MKTKIQGFIVARQYRWEKAPEYTFYPKEMTHRSDGDVQYVTVCPHVLAFDLPDSFDMSGPIIKSLRAQQTKVRAEAEAKITQIEDRIQSMLSLPNLVQG